MTYTRGEKIAAVLLGLAMGVSLLAVAVTNFSRGNGGGSAGYETPGENTPNLDNDLDDEVEVTTPTTPSPVVPAAPRP